MIEPTNADLFVLIENQTDEFKKHAEEDRIVAEKQGGINKEQGETNKATTRSLDALHEWKKTVATREDVREIFAEELRAFFTGSGKNTKKFLIGTAVVVGALTVIFGGLKSIFIWISYFLPK